MHSGPLGLLTGLNFKYKLYLISTTEQILSLNEIKFNSISNPLCLVTECVVQNS